MRWLLMALLLPLAACGSPAQRLPGIGYQYRELLAAQPFDQLDGWRSYHDGEALFLGIADGAYRIAFSGRRYAWTQGARAYADAVIEARARQMSSFDNNAFGLACRLDAANSGRGYYFLISGDGYASIRWGNGRSLQAIVAAAPSTHIKRGQASNLIRAVCIGDYLGLWVNGQFVMEARDGRASQGAAGLAGFMRYAGREIDITFDDLKIWRAALDARES